MAVATNVAGERRGPDEGGAGLDGVLNALRALRPGGCGAPAAPACCTWVCTAVVGAVRDRGVTGPVPADDPAPDPEFEAVLVRRLAQRYLRTVAGHGAGRPVPLVWELLLAPPVALPARLALAGVGTLLDYDLTLALVGTCTVLGRTPGSRERAAHRNVAALLGARGGDVVGRAGDPAEIAAAAGLAGASACDAAWGRAEHLWTLRGRPAEAEAVRDRLDLQVRAGAVRVLSGRR